jgi:hypothetical protein
MGQIVALPKAAPQAAARNLDLASPAYPRSCCRHGEQEAQGEGGPSISMHPEMKTPSHLAVQSLSSQSAENKRVIGLHLRAGS